MDMYLFSDEAGDFTFNRQPNVSRYFIICTLVTSSIDLGISLTKLRHELIREGAPVGDYFHATNDAQSVRDRVYAQLANSEFTFQATICEKSKAHSYIRQSKPRFYQYPWFHHFRHGIVPHIKDKTRILVTAASIGDKKERKTYTNALEDVVRKTALTIPWAVDFRPALADPCLQAADYCAWALQRKWERNDERALSLIKDKLTYEYDLWQHKTKHYY